MAEMPPFLCAKLIKREFVQETLNVEVGLSYNEDQVGIFALLLRQKFFIDFIALQ